MRWNISSGPDEVEGPFEEQDIIASLRAGHYGGAQVAPEGTQDWRPIAGYPPFASAVATAGTAGGSEGLGIALLIIPLVATALTWLWVGNMNLLQDPSTALIGLSIATVLITAVLIAVEASQIGMGTLLNKKGKKDSGPVTLFIASCLVWVVVFPFYMARRSHYRRKSLVVGGALVAIVFSLSSAIMGTNIESQKAEVRRRMQEARVEFERSQRELEESQQELQRQMRESQEELERQMQKSRQEMEESLRRRAGGAPW